MTATQHTLDIYLTVWMCPMLLNILMVLANFPGLIIQFSQKTSAMTVATMGSGATENVRPMSNFKMTIV